MCQCIKTLHYGKPHKGKCIPPQHIEQLYPPFSHKAFIGILRGSSEPTTPALSGPGVWARDIVPGGQTHLAEVMVASGDQDIIIG